MNAIPKNNAEQINVSKTLRKWFEQQVRMHPDEINLRELIEKATNDLGQDPEFRYALVEEGIRLILPIIAARYWQRERRQQRASPNLMPLDAAHQTAERLTKWYEHVGDTIHKRLGAMNRQELHFVANMREKRITTEKKTIKFERSLAEQMPNDTVTVERYFKPEELTKIWENSFDIKSAK